MGCYRMLQGSCELKIGLFMEFRVTRIMGFKFSGAAWYEKRGTKKEFRHQLFIRTV